MNIRTSTVATLATCSMATMSLCVPVSARPPQGTEVTAPARKATGNPLQYVQRGTSAKGDFVRTLSLFGDGRALMVSVEADTGPVTVQTGTWKRGSRADRFSISLTRQNEKPYKETILLTGKPGKGGTLSAIGTVSTQYGAYGLTFAPRIANNLSLSPPNERQEVTLTATGVTPTPLGVVKQARVTADGYDALYWKSENVTAAADGTVESGEALYYFNTLTGKARRIAGFPAPITQVEETRLSSGRPVWVVSYGGDTTVAGGVAVVDPIRERTVKVWRAARLTGMTPGKITVAGATTYRAQGSTAAQTVSLDRYF